MGHGHYRGTLRCPRILPLTSPVRQTDPDTQAALGLGVRGDRAAVGVGDGGDDGRAESVPVAVTA
jgi:hypothetical protein